MRTLRGAVYLHFNGKQQKLVGGGTRYYSKTMDGGEVAPKWGAYNLYGIGTEISLSLADMRIGTDLGSVVPKVTKSGKPAFRK